MRPGVGPFAEPGWRKRLAANILEPLTGTYSGELSANVTNLTLGATRFAGEIVGVWMSVGASGKDDSNELNISGEVYINGNAVLTTPAMIAHISGETSQAKTTLVTGDTGITQAVFSGESWRLFNPGDVITGKFTVQRTASPTTEIANPVIVVELEPIK